MEENWIENALQTKSDIKVIMKGSIEENDKNDKLGVTSIVYISRNSKKVKKIYDELIKKDTTSFFMIYAVNFDTMLTDEEHFPSIAISPDDFTNN